MTIPQPPPGTPPDHQRPSAPAPPRPGTSDAAPASALAGPGADAAPETAEARVRTWLRRTGLPAATPIAHLAGDASDRRYVRVTPADGPARVLMVHAGPIDPATLPFVGVAALFRQLSIPIPTIHDVDPALGIVVVDDLGGTMLEDAVAARPARDRDAHYREAVEIIAALQRGGRRLAGAGAGPFGLALDAARLAWELDFFVEHFVAGYRRRALAPAARATLGIECRALAAEVAADPRVLCHRDFHSRNLMVHQGRLHVIDFQDARMGPDTYDLVSLLRDAYVELDLPEVDRLMAHYQTVMGIADGAALRRRFRRATVQRGLKALGTFGYQIAVRGNPRYRDAIPRTIAGVRHALAHDRRRRRLGDLLDPLLSVDAV